MMTVEPYSIKNIRISTKHVQIDIFLASKGSASQQSEIVKRIAKSFESDIGSVKRIVNLTAGLVPEGESDPEKIIERVIETFNDEAYWEAQEVAEILWRKTREPNEKNAIQGLILAGAALVHHQRNEDTVCLSMFHRALEKLNALDKMKMERRSFLNIDLQLLRNEIMGMVSDGIVRGVQLKRA